MNPMSLYLNNLLAVMAMMLLGWLFSLVRRNVTVADSLWGIGFVLIAWLTWWQADGYTLRQGLIVGATTLWGIRLSAHLTWRNHGKGEDPRYAEWRRRNGSRFWLVSLFKVFMLQALFLWAIALVIQAGQTGPYPNHLTVLDVLGILIWFVGFGFEAVGDWQLARFKSSAANRGRVMDRGLWRYTRHPNYFGETLIWWGMFVIALSDTANWWTVVSPVIITVVLLKMTGIPLTESSIMERRPAYKEYIERTSPFFPRRPKELSGEGGGIR